eukprot:1882341-Karenia_brevis.AAC.1
MSYDVVPAIDDIGRNLKRVAQHLWKGRMQEWLRTGWLLKKGALALNPDVPKCKLPSFTPAAAKFEWPRRA